MNEQEKINFKKDHNDRIRKARANIKPSNCMLCGKPITSFCNSHSVPKFSLKYIANKGELLRADVLTDPEKINISSGLNKTGTFYLICNECDGTFFQDYESEKKLKGPLSDKMLAEIAVKNVLIQLFNKKLEISYIRIFQNETNFFENFDDYEATLQFDVNTYIKEFEFHKNIAEKSISGGYQIIYHEILPYKIPIAFQGMIAMKNDFNGQRINELHYFKDLSYKIQHLHILALPFENESCLLAFYHKTDKNYQKLRHHFNSISRDEKLKCLNYLIFEYAENYFFSSKIDEELKTNKYLKQLSREANGRPDFGLLTEENSYGIGYKPVSMDDIPVFLSKEWAI